MTLSIVALAAALCMAAQDPAEKPKPDAVDPKLHADAVRLVELSGARERMQEGLDKILKDGAAQYAKMCTDCDPAVGDEWARRMKSKLKVDDFMAIVVHAYEKYLNDDDITQLIALMTDQKGSPAKQPLPELQKKLTSVSPSLQSEILGGGTQLGSKLGAETELEIRKDHPEYFKAPAKPNR
jgi:hypothetical protein